MKGTTQMVVTLVITIVAALFVLGAAIGIFQPTYAEGSETSGSIIDDVRCVFGKNLPGCVEEEEGDVAGSAWTTKTIDSEGDVGFASSVGVFDAKHVFVVYADTTNRKIKVARTASSGSTWTTSEIASGSTSASYNSIAVVSPTVAFVSFISGGKMYVYKTTDGMSWTATNNGNPISNDNAQFTSIDATDASNVFAAYYSSDSTDLMHAYTSDGGATWSDLTVDMRGEVGLGSDIDAVDTDTFFISYKEKPNGIYVIKLTGGGADRRKTKVDEAVMDTRTSISAVDANTIYVAYPDIKNPPKYRVGKTIDGGQTWEVLIVDDGARASAVSLVAMDADSAYTTYLDTESGELRVAYTSNGGATWKKAKLADDSFSPSIDAISSKTAFITYQNMNSKDLLVSYKTSDEDLADTDEPGEDVAPPPAPGDG